MVETNPGGQTPPGPWRCLPADESLAALAGVGVCGCTPHTLSTPLVSPMITGTGVKSNDV